jgi:beta-1,4-mannosyl-glycoprotein beta-1,4-N-acetylglucosaminyltransferase
MGGLGRSPSLSLSPMDRRHRRLLSLAAAFSILFLIFIYSYQIRNTLSYASRPLWDKPQGPRHVVPHYYAEGIAFSESHCGLHGWKLREDVPEVWDAVLFSTELDLLEIRMHELDAVVDKFFIIESDRMSSHFWKHRPSFVDHAP